MKKLDYMRYSKKDRYERLKPDDDCMKEECGVFGIYLENDELDPAEACYLGLFALQHRGQESAGIATTDGNGMKLHRDMGLCEEVFRNNIDGLLGGKIGIGHVRYSTAGDRDISNAQPLMMSFRNGKMALAHNGNLINATILREKLEEDGAIFQTALDTEVMAYLIAKNSSEGMIESIRRMTQIVRGSYAMVIATNDTLIGVRDPLGIRPLALGRIGDSFMLASESCAFDTVDGEFVRDVHPGEVIVIDKTGFHSYPMQRQPDSALCVFEFVYFARPDSDIDGISVYRARENMGRRLAMAYPIEADLVAGVPDSATPAAVGYAQESGIPFKSALNKNRYVGRTFIQPKQSIRERSVKLKLNAMKRIVYGKRIILIDDSIVRGTTSKKIVEMLRLAGAREVHMLISSPTVICPCFFGIDTPSHDQLIASKNSVDDICRIIGADSLHFLSGEDLLKTVEGAGCNFCTGCFDGNYPMDIKECCAKTQALTLEQIYGENYENNI